jgi:hypothetical protein
MFSLNFSLLKILSVLASSVIQALMKVLSACGIYLSFVKFARPITSNTQRSGFMLSFCLTWRRGDLDVPEKEQHWAFAEHNENFFFVVRGISVKTSNFTKRQPLGGHDQDAAGSYSCDFTGYPIIGSVRSSTDSRSW